ncbi:MAG TPA: amino acid ABC transporter permease [Actinomycetota bacterium]|nr:amino acid ABC transporter permease [Actinomycetota bacterium]
MAISTDALEPVPIPEAPVARRLPPREWIKENLLAPWHNAVLTIVFGTALLYVTFRVLRFVFVTGRWEIVRVNLTNFMAGLFPRAQLWRVWVAVFVIVLAFGFRLGAASAARVPAEGPKWETGPAWRRALGRGWPLGLFVTAVAVLSGSGKTIGLILAVAATGVAGFRLGMFLPPRRRRWATIATVLALVAGFQIIVSRGGVGYGQWGGLLLTLFLAVAGIALSFPLGVLLALGRRSKLPVVRAICVGYIEVIRGVPLLALIFMGTFAIGFLLPSNVRTPDVVTRGLIALIAFTAAYVAEIVRGGLQSVPRGQIEAAKAVGLSPLKVTRLIVLPQALRAVIPALVGQFISLFKDTSLIAVIGITELLGVARFVTKQPDFLAQGLEAETLVFVSFIYWVGAYWMSRESRRLELRLGVGVR